MHELLPVRCGAPRLVRDEDSVSVPRTAALTFPSAAHSCLQKGLVR